MSKILISGGTGLVGKHLCRKLQEKGYNVAILSRKKNKNSEIPSYTWNIVNDFIEKEAIETADYIIHLTGENIGSKRWTTKRKQSIIDSRIKSAQLIFNKLNVNNHKIKAFISASAVGYYGSLTSEKIFEETSPYANDFLGSTCYQWEQAADKFQNIGIRTVKIRTAVVLAKDKSILAKLIIPVRLGIASAIGTGNQYIPWIHIDDLCNIYIKAIEDHQMIGVFNAVAPEHNTNKEFILTLAQVRKKPFWFPKIPSILMKLLFGELSVILLKGSRVSSDKIKATGFSFQYAMLEKALIDLMGKK